MKISVIIPVYNVEKYLDKCLKSVVGQSFDDYEVLVVIDGSEDGSEVIARRYEKNYPQIIKVICQENKGLGGARNTGISMARGEYLVFIDSDDMVHPSFLQKVYSKARSEDADMVVFDIEYVTEDGTKLRYEPARIKSSERIQFHDKSRILLWPGAWNKIYKRELFVKNNIWYPERLWFEDLATTPKLMVNAKRIAYIPEAYYYYVQREDSIMSSKKISRNIEIITAFESILRFFKESGEYENYKKELEFLAIYHVLYTAAVRINKNDYRSEIQMKLVDYIEGIYPQYMKNSYLKELMSRKEKTVIYLISKRRFRILNKMFQIVEKLK